MKSCLSLTFAALASLATLPSHAGEPDTIPPARLGFADGWALRSGEALDGRQAEPAPAVSPGKGAPSGGVVPTEPR